MCKSEGGGHTPAIMPPIPKLFPKLFPKDGKKVQDCRIALGAVAPTVIRLRAVEDALIGAVLSPEAIDQSAVTAGELCSPISDIRSNVEYRRRMAGVLVGRGLKSILREL